MALPVLFLPGMMCDARLFAPQIAALSQERAVQVAALTGQDSTAAMAAEVLAHAPPRFALAGLSMGGIVAMEVLAQAPDRVARLALLDTNPLAEVPQVQERRAPQIARALSGALAQVMREDMMPRYLAPGSDPALLDLCLEMALDLGPAVFARQSLALRDRPDRQAVLAGHGGPALVLMGEGDRLCPRDRHDLMHALMPQSRLAVIAGAGHLPTLEQPEAVTAELRRWLADG